MDNSATKIKRGRDSFSRFSFDNNRGSFDYVYDENNNRSSERTNSIGNSNMLMKRSKTVHNFTHVLDDNNNNNNNDDSSSPTTFTSKSSISKSKSSGMLLSNNNNADKGSYYNQFQCDQKTSFNFFFNEKSTRNHEIDKTSILFESLFEEFN